MAGVFCKCLVIKVFNKRTQGTEGTIGTKMGELHNKMDNRYKRAKRVGIRGWAGTTYICMHGSTGDGAEV